MEQEHPRRFEVRGKEVSVFAAAAPGAPIVYLNTFGGEGAAVHQVLMTAQAPDHTLVAVGHLNWDHDMAPWDCPPLSRDDTPCTGGADDYLQLLLNEIAPQVEGALAAPPAWQGLAGYSLAGLFAVYSLYRTDAFARIASASGSLWFPNFLDFATTHPLARTPEAAYFSLGNKEAKVRNPLLRPVQENTERLEAYFASLGIATTFQLNPGNHFVNAPERTAAAIAWMLRA